MIAMEKDIKSFKVFYRSLRTHVTKWNHLINEADEPLTALSNLTHRLRHVLRVEPENEMSVKFPGLKDRILAKIYMTLEEVLSSLWRIDDEMSSINNELRMRLSQLEQAQRPSAYDENASDIRSKENINENWNCVHPRFDDLLVMAADAWRYYHNFWLNIHTGLLCFDYTDEESFRLLEKSFVVDSESEKNVKWTLAVTTYFIED